ncbi:heparinase II/III domain-containing protein [Terasakiella sp.]|uniref:heparinase II/III domain-containing protein n=1 Tax=Terasakiella sp. TaxID=2034861 RepID=UPI003AA8B86A
MRLFSLLKKVRRTPLNELPGKVRFFISRRWQKVMTDWHDRFVSPYTPPSKYSVQFRPLSEKKECLHLPEEDQKCLMSAVALWMNHQFQVLGAGVAPADFNAGVAGLKNIKLSCEKKTDEDLKVFERDCVRLRAFIDSDYTYIDWHRDRRSGWSWPRLIRPQEIEYGVPEGSDVKNPWELSRMQHLPSMALYALTLENENQKREILAEMRNQIFDFCQANPPGFGVNWACPMDISLRLISWVVCYDLLRGEVELFTKAEHEEFIARLVDHAQYIEKHIEWNPSVRGNHYYINCLGLLIAGATLRGHPSQGKWLAYGAGTFLNETSLQFLKTGGNFESSTYYHRLMSEAACLGLTVLVKYQSELQTLPKRFIQQASGMPGGDVIVSVFHQFSEQIASAKTRLRQSYLFSMWLINDGGAAPQFGDNDGGRSLPLIPDIKGCFDNPSDWSRHIGFWQGLFEAEGKTIEAKYLQSIAICEHLSVSIEDDGHKAFPDFGLYAWRRRHYRFWFKVSSTGQHGNGGHDHCDCLSFELSWKNKPLIIQPGTGVYTPLPKVRNKHRAAAFHNGPVGKKKVNHYFGQGTEELFKISHPSKVIVQSCDQNEIHASFEQNGEMFSRYVHLEGDRISFEDKCESSSHEPVYVFLILPLSLTIENKGKEGVLIDMGDFLLQFEGNASNIEIGRDEYSPTYGEFLPCFTLSLTQQHCLRWSISEKA